MATKAKSLPMLVFTHEFFPKKAGVSVFVQEVALAASRAGRAVVVFAPDWTGRKRAKFSYAVKPLSPAAWRLSTVWHLARSRRICREAVLYLPEQRAIRVMMYLQWLNLVRPATLVITLHGSEITYFDALPHRRLLFARLLERADRITVLSDYCRQLLFDRFPMSADKVRVVPGAVRSGFENVRRRRARAADKLVILTVARIHPRKGQMTVLAAMNALGDRLKQSTVYRIVGPTVDEKYRRSLETYAAAHDLTVEFVGEVDDRDLPAVYQDADLFVMASNEHTSGIGLLGWRYREKNVEGYGLSYLEAAAAGLAVLAYDTGGVRDAVESGETGILVDAGDADELVRALRRLLTDSSLRARLGESGRRRAHRFSWRDAVEAILGGA